LLIKADSVKDVGGVGNPAQYRFVLVVVLVVVLVFVIE
jgi:hypothetical protein